MKVRIIEIGPAGLAQYALIPSRFWISTLLQVEEVTDGWGGLKLREVPVANPYWKDYDSYGELPTDWPALFDVSQWGFFLSVAGQKPAGAAAVAIDTPGCNMLDGRRDLAALWDIRIHPEYRGAGIALFKHIACWSRGRGCRQMKVETQNVNVPACRFYRQMGCHLGEIRGFAYAAHPALAHEVMLNWYLDLNVEGCKGELRKEPRV